MSKSRISAVNSSVYQQSQLQNSQYLGARKQKKDFVKADNFNVRSIARRSNLPAPNTAAVKVQIPKQQNSAAIKKMASNKMLNPSGVRKIDSHQIPKTNDQDFEGPIFKVEANGYFIDSESPRSVRKTHSPMSKSKSPTKRPRTSLPLPFKATPPPVVLQP